jgi:hypothetical protein
MRHGFTLSEGVASDAVEDRMLLDTFGRIKYPTEDTLLS